MVFWQPQQIINRLTSSPRPTDFRFETHEYIDFVKSNGGTVGDKNYIDLCIRHAIDHGYWHNVDFWASPNFGYKTSGGQITHLFDLKGQVVETTESLTHPTLVDFEDRKAAFMSDVYTMIIDTITMNYGEGGLVACVARPGISTRGSFVGLFGNAGVEMGLRSGGWYTTRAINELVTFETPLPNGNLGHYQSSFWRPPEGDRAYLGGVESSTGIVTTRTQSFSLNSLGTGRGSVSHDAPIAEWLIASSGITSAQKGAIEDLQSIYYFYDLASASATISSESSVESQADVFEDTYEHILPLSVYDNHASINLDPTQIQDDPYNPDGGWISDSSSTGELYLDIDLNVPFQDAFPVSGEQTVYFLFRGTGVADATLREGGFGVTDILMAKEFYDPVENIVSGTFDASLITDFSDLSIRLFISDPEETAEFGALRWIRSLPLHQFSVPSSIVSSYNLSGTVSDIQDAPMEHSYSGWLTVDDPLEMYSEINVEMSTPEVTISGTQVAQFLLRTDGSESVECYISLLQSSDYVKELGSVIVDSSSRPYGKVVSFEFDATDLTGQDNVRFHIMGNAINDSAAIEVGAVRWLVNV